ncbi:MAG TPA: DUF4230 domain-containing protein [Microthrixaceae bacterium]|nr:DUF4230 domain-containing protein [Microthrixaceae bacterium]HMT23619.1 DUF4230 domain-containing protein [Microthrixaceae bacterium]HMT61151.1 DUF4230 domain-containing protein [Microthrixaceae bacterium]
MWKWLGIAAVVLVVANFTGFDPIGSLREGLFGLEQRPEAAAVTLAAIHKTSELRTASGEFSVPVTFGQEQSGAVHEVLPDALDADSGVALYYGSVDALVDLKGLAEDDIVVDRSKRSITIRVPRPVLTKPNIDESRSTVVAQNRGLLTRLGELFNERPLAEKDSLDEVAVEALTKAAQDSDLTEKAEQNAREFLTLLANRMGYDDVVVEFVDAPST